MRASASAALGAAPRLTRLLRRIPCSEQVKAIVIVATMVLGLALDQAIEIWGQIVVSGWTWLVFLWLLESARGNERRTLLAMLVISTGVEIFFSLVWGLYVYRLQNVPAFVPPGHALLLVLGAMLARRVGAALAWWLAAGGALYAGVALVTGFDGLSAALWLVFTAACAFGPARRVYASMFLLSLALELYGTWLGNWTWMREVPWLGWSTSNPPGFIGAGYCLLDLAVLAAVRLGDSRLRRVATGGSSAVQHRS